MVSSVSKTGNISKIVFLLQIEKSSGQKKDASNKSRLSRVSKHKAKRGKFTSCVVKLVIR